MKKITLGLIGASGKMGSIFRQYYQSLGGNCPITSLILLENKTSLSLLPMESKTFHLEELFSLSDIVLDFSSPSLWLDFSQNILMYHSFIDKKMTKPLIIASTGVEKLNDFFIQFSQENSMAILNAPNLSRSVTRLIGVLNSLTSVIQGPSDVAVFDLHHQAKRDKPSGTALKILHELSSCSNSDCNFHRENFSGVRLGHIPAEHEIIIAGQFEIIRLNHQIFDRQLYAKEAIEAVLWLMQKQQGFYSVKDWILDNDKKTS